MSKLSVTMIRQVQAVAKLYLEHESQRLERVAAARQAANKRPRSRRRAPAL